MATRQKGIHRLGNARDIERLPEGLHPDGGSLYLQVRGGCRSWLFRTRLNNLMGLGPTHTITPEEAREEARQCRLMQMRGIDPLAAKRTRLEDAKLATSHAKTFREVAEEYLDAKAQTWKPGAPGRKGTLAQIAPRFARHINPIIGDVPIHRFDMRPKRNSATDLVDRVLAPLWKANKMVTARSIQQCIKGVLDRAIARNYGDLAGSDNAASVEDGSPLAILRPKIKKVYAFTSHAAFPWEDIGRLVAALREYTGPICQVCAHPKRAAIDQTYGSGVSYSKMAERFSVSPSSIFKHKQHMGARKATESRPTSAYVMELIILTAVRKAQVNTIRWAEVDMKNAVWRCEEHKTRQTRINRRGETVLIGEAHVIHLSKQAMAVLHAMKAQGIDSEFVFPKRGRGCSDLGQHVEQCSVNKWVEIFKKMRPEFANVDFTPHGMRTAFKSWARSQGIDDLDSEIALAHDVGTAVSRIYARDADTIERRRPMMQKWADHCDRVGPAPDVVVPFPLVKTK
ncbi:MAG: tyrosine-type recombinase/integrase [Methyloceanibacter sp.]